MHFCGEELQALLSMVPFWTPFQTWMVSGFRRLWGAA